MGSCEPGVPEPQGLSKDEAFVVRLTSDVLVRNKHGQHDPYALKHILEDRLKDKATVTNIGVAKALSKGQELSCGCIGTGFKV